MLRFTTHQIQEETETYCIRTITKTINKLGGVDEDGAYQLGLFGGF